MNGLDLKQALYSSTMNIDVGCHRFHLSAAAAVSSVGAPPPLNHNTWHVADDKIATAQGSIRKYYV